jgi:hypothetical protein
MPMTLSGSGDRIVRPRDGPGVSLWDDAGPACPGRPGPQPTGSRASSASDLGWAAVSPSGDFDHGGVPVGGYRLAPADAASQITYADQAIALVDEAERPVARRGHVGVVRPG